MFDHLAFYVDAFSELSSDRPFGALGGAGAIPFSAIDRYAARYGVDEPDAFERFRRMIRAQDSAYLREAAEQAKVTRDKDKPGEGKSRGRG